MKNQGFNNSETQQKKIRVGIIGAGNIAKYAHLPSLKHLPDYEVTAIQSRGKHAAEEAANQFGIKYIVDTVDELVNHPEVDLVAVITPGYKHDEGIRAAISAKKDVYSEWPFTTSTKNAQELVKLAKEAGINTVIGLQRRTAPVSRYMDDLIKEGYIGNVRSVRVHVSDDNFGSVRPEHLRWSIPAENFNDVIVIFGAHFLDSIFNTFGWPLSFSSDLLSRYKKIEIKETGELLPNTTPDELVLSGRLRNDAVISVHIEGGKRNGKGVQIDITGDKGDLKLTNKYVFGGIGQDYILQGAQGEDQPLRVLTVPESYIWLKSDEMGTGPLELGHEYAAYAKDLKEGTSYHTTFDDALKMHHFFDLLNESSEKGIRVNMK
jgi:predicted dehydrogenase